MTFSVLKIVAIAGLAFVAYLWLFRHRIRNSEGAKIGATLGAVLTGEGMNPSTGGDIRLKKGLRLDRNHADGTPKARETVSLASDR